MLVFLMRACTNTTTAAPPLRLMGDKAMEGQRGVSKGWKNRAVSINKFRIFDQKLCVIISYVEKGILKGATQDIVLQVKVIRTL